MSVTCLKKRTKIFSQQSERTRSFSGCLLTTYFRKRFGFFFFYCQFALRRFQVSALERAVCKKNPFDKLYQQRFSGVTTHAGLCAGMTRKNMDTASVSSGPPLCKNGMCLLEALGWEWKPSSRCVCVSKSCSPPPTFLLLLLPRSPLA